MGGDDYGQILGGGLGGGIGSAISGGDFWEGFGQGIAVGAFNHALHSVLSGGGDPIKPPTDFKLEGFPDTEYLGKSKGAGNRHIWKLPDGKYLEWTSKNGVVEMYNKTGKKWLGKFNPITGELISTTSKAGRIASFVGKGITFVGTKLSMIMNAIFYTGPGSGFDNLSRPQSQTY
jgi:hypothetical protein